jgi:hypothetical protein
MGNQSLISSRRSCPDKPLQSGACHGLCRCLWRSTAVAALLLILGCGAVNPGKWRGIEKTAPDEQYYLMKEVFLTGGGTAHPRENFDHNMHDVVSLFFMPANEKNTYVAESHWIDPDSNEYRTIRTTHDKQAEGKKGIERSHKGSLHAHTVTTGELFARKPGEWKVALYLDGKLARRLAFSVR